MREGGSRKGGMTTKWHYYQNVPCSLSTRFSCLNLAVNRKLRHAVAAKRRRRQTRRVRVNRAGARGRRAAVSYRSTVDGDDVWLVTSGRSKQTRERVITNMNTWFGLYTTITVERWSARETVAAHCSPPHKDNELQLSAASHSSLNPASNHSIHAHIMYTCMRVYVLRSNTREVSFYRIKVKTLRRSRMY